MPFHLAAFGVALGTVANTDVPALRDDVLVIANNHFLLQNDARLIFAAAMSATFNRARIVSPSNRQIALPYIRPVIRAATPGDDPNYANYSRYPFRVRALEELSIEATSDIAMGTEQATALIGLQDVFEPTPQGDIFTLRGTSTTASVANTWTGITMTWEQTPPQGIYSIVGLQCFGATEIAARLILENQLQRPGCVAVTSVGQKPVALFAKGELGVWGRLRSTAMPQVQVLNTAAVSVHEVFLEFIRIA